jgi:hypothetical protein
MDAEATLEEIRRLAVQRRIRLSYHASRERMLERGNLTFEDIRAALVGARSIRSNAHRNPGTWRVEGQDLDGDDLTCVVALEGDVVVITVF